MTFTQVSSLTQVSSPVLGIMSITSPSPGNYINSLNRTDFNVSGNCPVNGEMILITADDDDVSNSSITAASPCSLGIFSTSLDLSALSDGSVTITADRLDVAGNSLTRASVGVTKDTEAPDAPTSVALSAGTTSPSQSATPTITVEGKSWDGTPTLTNDLVVSIHTDDPSCELPSQKGFGKPTNNFSVDITSSDLPLDRTYYFYAKTTDPAGNHSCSYVYAMYERDTAPPTVAITSTNGADPTVKKVIPMSVTFSEPVSGFTSSALTVSGGTISNLGGSGDNYSFDLTLPTDSTGTFTIDIAANSANDAAGNGNIASPQYSKTFYTQTPTITGTTPTNSTTPTLTVGNIIPGLTANIYTDSNCTTLKGSGSNPSAGNSQPVTSSPISTSTTYYAAAADAQGNRSACSSAFYLMLDQVRPNVTIASTATANLTTLASIPITVTFSKPVTGFSLENISVTGGIKSAFTSSGSSYSFLFAPASNSTGTFTIDIAANSANDAAGNGNIASPQYSKTFYTQTPTITGTTPTNSTTPTLTVGNIIAGLTANIYTDSNCSTLKGSGSNPSAGNSQPVTSSPISTSTTYYAAAADAQGNKSACSAGFSLILDITPPTVVIESAITSNPTTKTVIPMTVTFIEPVVGFTEEDLSVTGTGGSVSDFSGSEANYTFDFTPTPNSTGTFTITILSNSFTDSVGNPNIASATYTKGFYTNTPTITGTTPTNSTTPTLTVGNIIAGLTANIYTDSNCSTLKGSGSNPSAGSSQPVTSGTISTSTTYYAAAADAQGNKSACSAEFSLILDITPPTVTVEQNISQPDPTNVSSIVFDVVFSEPINVTSFTADDITQNGTVTVPITWTITNSSGDGKNFTLTATGVSGTGTVQPTILANKVTDRAGNPNSDSTSNDNTVTFDNSPLNVTVDQASVQADPTKNLPILFKVTFNKPIKLTTFDIFDITQTGTATETGITWVITNPSGDHRNFDLAATAVTVAGTLIPTITVNKVQDLAGNNNTASTITDNSVLFDNIDPTITITSPPSSSYVNSANPTAVVISGACTDSLSGVTGQVVTLAATGNGSSSATAVCDGATFSGTINLSSLGDGSTTITASITDAAGNSATSSVSLIKDSSLPSAPTGLFMNPIGPANNNSPVITGSAEANTTVTIYATNNCNAPVAATGSASQLAAGISLSVLDNSTNYFSATSTDTAGNVSPCSTPSVTYIEDSAPPASTFVINNGTSDNALDTTSQSITTLKFTATDISSPITMCISNDSCESCNLSGYGYEAFSWTKPVTFSGNGLKAFYAKFKDGLGNETPCIKRTILYTNSGDSAVQARFQPAPDWNDYVKPDGATACTSADTSCIHGGEQRSVTVPETNCSGLSMTDTLLAFDWYCDDTNGSAIFTSRLKFASGLADLIDALALQFKNNSVTYSKNNVSEGSSSPARWWTNTIVALSGTDSSPTALLGAPLSVAKIYILNTGSVAYTGGFNINADKIAVVIAPGTTLAWSTGSTSNNVDTTDGNVGSPNAKAVLAAGTQNFIWIEGALSGSSSAGYGVFLHSVKFADIRRLSLSANLADGVHFESTTSSRMTNVTSAGNTLNGVYFNASNYNLLSGVFAANNGMSGLSFNSSNSNQLSAISSSGNTQHGIHFNSSSSNVGSDLKAANNTWRGIQLDGSTGNKLTRLRVYNNETGTTNGTSGGVTLSGSSQNYFQDVITANNHFDGFVLNGSSGNIITNLTSANQGASAYGFYFFSSSLNNILHNAAIVNNSSNAITDNNSAGANTVSQTALADNTTNTFSGPTQLPNILTNISGGLLSDFVVSGITATYSTAFNWFGLGSYQTWGLSSNARGRCTTGTCGISDWSLKKDVVSTPFANPIWNRTGDGSTHNSSYDFSSDTYLFPLASNNCPGEVDGSNSNNVSQIFTCSNPAYFTQATCTAVQGTTWTASKTFLKNAVEIIGDGVGNDDGLCESGEHCFYTPNFGAYQGHSNDGSKTECNFTGATGAGKVDIVHMFGFIKNGY